MLNKTIFCCSIYWCGKKLTQPHIDCSSSYSFKVTRPLIVGDGLSGTFPRPYQVRNTSLGKYCCQWTSSSVTEESHLAYFLAQLKLMTVYKQFILDDLLYGKPKFSCFQWMDNIHGCSSDNLNRNWCRLKKTLDSLTSQLVGLFNSLPKSVRSFRNRKSTTRIPGVL